MRQLAIIGGGFMGAALAQGLVDSGWCQIRAGFEKDHATTHDWSFWQRTSKQ